jgi:hypothetical protein
MNDPAALHAKALAVLGPHETIVATGIFGLRNNYMALTAGGVAGSMLAPGLAGVLGNAVGMRAAQNINAHGKGVTVRMLVVVTPTHIHILDWMTGSGPRQVLRSFDRGNTTVEIKKFGLSRHLNLEDRLTGDSLALTGSTSGISPEGKGDKEVLAVLG